MRVIRRGNKTVPQEQIVCSVCNALLEIEPADVVTKWSNWTLGTYRYHQVTCPECDTEISLSYDTMGTRFVAWLNKNNMKP